MLPRCIWIQWAVLNGHTTRTNLREDEGVRFWYARRMEQSYAPAPFDQGKHPQRGCSVSNAAVEKRGWWWWTPPPVNCGLPDKGRRSY